MTAYQLRWARAAKNARQRREVADWHRQRSGDLATIFQKIESFTRPRGYECALRLGDAPAISVWAPGDYGPALEITVDDCGTFIGCLAVDDVVSRASGQAGSREIFRGDERYEVIELVVQYVQASSALRSGTGLEDAPARPIKFPRRRGAALRAVPAEATAPAARRFPAGLAMALVAVATGAMLFVFKRMV